MHCPWSPGISVGIHSHMHLVGTEYGMSHWAKPGVEPACCISRILKKLSIIYLSSLRPASLFLCSSWLIAQTDPSKVHLQSNAPPSAPEPIAVLPHVLTQYASAPLRLGFLVDTNLCVDKNSCSDLRSAAPFLNHSTPLPFSFRYGINHTLHYQSFFISINHQRVFSIPYVCNKQDPRKELLRSA